MPEDDHEAMSRPVRSTSGIGEGGIEGSPPAERVINESLVKSLLREQKTELSHLPLRYFDGGFDNVMFRLGDSHLVRVPRRTQGAKSLLAEQIWLPRIEDAVALRVPTPLLCGRKTATFDWPWSIVPWIVGETADHKRPLSSEAHILARFLLDLHGLSCSGAPVNKNRGCSLHERVEQVEARMRNLDKSGHGLSSSIEAIWQKALRAPSPQKRVLIHGDLHARNILVEQGRLNAVLDWGDLCAGDPAVDLAAVWMIFDDPSARKQLLSLYQANAATVTRAKGWAINFAVILLDTGLVDQPDHARMGKRTLINLDNDQGD